MQDIAAELAALDGMTTGDLAKRYHELHGQPCRTRHRQYLIRKIAWRIQANAEGGLPSVPAIARRNWPTTLRSA